MNQSTLKITYKFTHLDHIQIINLLEEYRVARNINRSEFSTLAGYTPSTYCHLARGKARFSKISFNKFMDVLSKVSAPAKNSTDVTAKQDDIGLDDYDMLMPAITLLKSKGYRIYMPKTQLIEI
jgi:hypothetical protein